MQGLADFGGRLVHLRDVPVLQTFGGMAHIEAEIDGGGGPGADAALLHGSQPTAPRCSIFAAGQTARRVAQHQGAATVGIVVGELHTHDAAEGLANVHHPLRAGVVEDGDQVSHQGIQGGFIVVGVDG